MSEGLKNGAQPIKISVPEEISFIRSDLQRFFDAMIFKLRRNKAKGRWEQMDLKIGLAKLHHEVGELITAIDEGNTTEILTESADVANWALIIANIALEAKGV